MSPPSSQALEEGRQSDPHGRHSSSPVRKTVGPGPEAEARLERISGLAPRLLSETKNGKSEIQRGDAIVTYQR